MRRLLYLEDLYNFYVSQGKNVKFSSKNTDATIVVHIDEPFAFSEKDQDDLNLTCPIRLCHIDKNVNKSKITMSSMEEAIPSAYNMPILAYIYKDDDGNYQFAGHEFFVNDENEIEYEEVPVGTIPESASLQLVYDEDADKTYLDGNGIIWRTYSRAADIIEREKKLWVSVELVVDELSFDSKEKVLVLEKFRFSGVTILGRDRYTGEEIQPGMVGSNISLADFSEKNNSVFSHNDKVIELLSILNEKIDNLNIQQISKEGGKEPSMKKNFEMDSNEAEAEVKETPSAKFDGDDPVVEEPSTEEETTEEESTETDEPVVEDPVVEEPVNNETVSEEGEDVLVTQHDDDDEDTKKTMSVSVSRGDVTKTFAVSLQDKIEALYTLVNDTYAEQDGVWYDCDVYDDEKYVIMHSWWTNDAYKQSYKVKKDVYSLVGDRVPVKAVWCTEDEQKALENMRANYSAIQEELAQFKAEPEKLAIIHSECYEQISDTEAFKKLAERDTYFSMSVEDVRAEADRQLLEYAKHNEIKFADKAEKKSVGVNIFAKPTDKKPTGNTRYGKLFTK